MSFGTGQMGNALRGSPPSAMKVPRGFGLQPNFTPDQMQLFQSLFSHVNPQSFLSQLAGGSQQAFDQMEAPALRQFGALQGNLASRFSGQGARRSSAFQNTLGAETSNFAQNLAAQRQSLQRQALQDLFGLSNDLLEQRPYSIYQKPERSSFLSRLLGGGSGLAGAGLGYLFGGGPGAALGGNIGSSFGKSFF